MYKYVRATVSEGSILIVYRLERQGAPEANLRYDDEDVSEWTDQEIRTLVASLIGVEESQESGIEVIWG